MGNRPRNEKANVLFHVIARSVNDNQLFPDDGWRTAFAGALSQEAEERNWEVWAYCLMGTHYHVLMSTPDASISDGFQRAHLRLASRRNSDQERSGRLLDTRFRMLDIRSQNHLFSCLRYIPMNPVKAQLCAHPADWKWSSFSATAGLAPNPSWLRSTEVLEYLSRDSGADFARWVTSSNDAIWLPDPPMNDRDQTRYAVELLLSQGVSNGQIAEQVGISRRWVERLAVRSELHPPK